MTTYRDQLKADMARIEKDVESDEITVAFTRKAGAYDAFAYYYASSADHEAAKAQRLGRDPKAFIAAFTGQIAGPSAEDIAILLGELHAYLRLRPELEDVKFAVEEATHACEYQAGCERERTEEAAAEELAANERQRANLIERGITTC
jgi:hypothetical protein